MPDLRHAVVAITGASSGIGRAAALAFVREGSRVALAARGEESLRGVQEDCEALGGEALVVPADVAEEAAVEEFARRVVDAYGRLDVWVNSAAVTAFGRFEEIPSKVFRRVIETNLLGSVHGARAALRAFRRQGSGVLINVSSVVGEIGQPLASGYAASKAALVGFSRSLREELRGTGIHVSCILPAATDTPFFHNGANYTGRAVRPVGPIAGTGEVARAIVRTAKQPRPYVYIGSAGRVAAWLHRVAPVLLERLTAWQIETRHFTDGFAYPTPGNVFAPKAETAGVCGGWKERRLTRHARGERPRSPSGGEPARPPREGARPEAGGLPSSTPPR